jgi:hypothetical protein
VEKYTKEELEEALRSITLTLNKCEKVKGKLIQGTSQWTLLIRRIKALDISIALLKKELDGHKL